jgi:hypothetical protein
MSSSSQTIIDHPNVVCTIPGSGAIYVQSGTLGVDVRQPTGPSLTWTAKDFAGGGATFTKQNGRQSGYHATTNLPLLAMQLPGILTPIAAGTTLLAPDMSVGDGVGTSSYYRLQNNAIIDWVGGIAAPVLPGGVQNYGVIAVLNGGLSAGVVNILDVSIGGAVRLPWTSMALGFQELCALMYDVYGWALWARAGGVQICGGHNMGSRRLITLDAAPHWLMKYPRNAAGYTAGIGFSGGDVVATGPGGAYYEWQGVTAAWDPADALVLSSTPTAPLVAHQGGNGAGVALGLQLTLSTDASYLNLNGVGANATRVDWRANNFQQISGV